MLRLFNQPLILALMPADTYPNEVSGIENGTTLNDIKVRTFSISPYGCMNTNNHKKTGWF